MIVVAPGGSRMGGIGHLSGPAQLPFWPLGAMMWGFGVSWLLGLTQIAPLVLSMVMLVLMIKRGGSRVPGPILIFLGFVLWVLPCALMIDSSDRMIGYALRLSILVAVGITMVYVYNAPELITKQRVVYALVAVWFTVLVGGYLALIAPYWSFNTLVSMLLPQRLLNNDYVHDLFVPTLAEIQRPWGAPEPFTRPAAPFPYTNGWGAAVVLLTPVVIGALTKAGPVRRVVLLAALAAMLVPAVATSNRGMFLGLAAAAAYICIRLIVRGKVGIALTVIIGAALGAFAMVRGGLLEEIAVRQEYSKSTDSRAALYWETLARTAESPVLGYGAPRPSLTNVVSAGTQGYVWMVMFSFGFVGLALLVGFLVSAVLATWRAPDTQDLCLHSVLIAACVIISFYGLDIMQWLAIGVVAAVLLRDRAQRRRAVHGIHDQLRSPRLVSV